MTTATEPAGRARSAPRAALWDTLDTSRVVIALILAYCGIHFVVRLALSPVYVLDEAEQLMFSQALSWGYRFRHPPLITWITWFVQQGFGLDRTAFFAMKYAIMAGGFVALYGAGRIILRDSKLAALAVGAFTLTYTIGYYPHVDLMHTVLLTSMLGLALYQLVRMIEYGTWADYLLFGAICALGVLSKYVFALFPLAAALAIALTPAFRRRILAARACAALLVCLAMLAPYAWWAASLDYSMVDLTKTVTRAESGIDPLAWVTGLGWFAWAVLEFTLPFSVIFALMFGRDLIRGTAAGTDPHVAGYARLLGLTMAIAAVAMLAAVFLAGATHFKGRWMHQVLMPLPTVLFALVALRIRAAPLGRLKALAVMMIVTLALTVTGRIAAYRTHSAACKNCWEYQPFPAYAAGLKERGFHHGTLLVDTMYTGGNLRVEIPEARILMPGYPLSVFPESSGTGACALAWLGEEPDPPAALDPLLARLGVETLPATAERGRVRRKIDGGADRWLSMNYVVIPEGVGACR